MKCPNCTGKLKIIRTYKTDRHTARDCRCISCGHKRTTIEVILENNGRGSGAATVIKKVEKWIVKKPQIQEKSKLPKE